jgi:catechol 2,3-dioxygenase-like lactoylglutathione lyase family enzyme
MTAIRILTIDHVVLRVADVERALRFYCGVLGCIEERRIEPLGLIQLRAGTSLIDLVDLAAPLGAAGGAAPGAEGRNLDHFALELAEFDEAAIRAHLKAHDVEAGDVGERYGAQGFGPSLYLRDPDGNVVELKGPASRTHLINPDRARGPNSARDQGAKSQP